jgi:hypothetical protein
MKAAATDNNDFLAGPHGLKTKKCKKTKAAAPPPPPPTIINDVQCCDASNNELLLLLLIWVEVGKGSESSNQQNVKSVSVLGKTRISSVFIHPHHRQLLQLLLQIMRRRRQQQQQLVVVVPKTVPHVPRPLMPLWARRTTTIPSRVKTCPYRKEHLHLLGTTRREQLNI